MIDVDVVLRKLTSLREHVARVVRRRPANRRAFVNDIDLQDAVAMSLLVATQDAIDIALHVASDEGWGIPASYAESFDLLAKRSMISADLARSLAGLAALRNRLAHGYGTIDPERLWLELPGGVDVLERFAVRVAAHAQLSGSAAEQPRPRRRRAAASPRPARAGSKSRAPRPPRR